MSPKPSSHRALRGIALSLSFAATACATTYRVRPADLAPLHGWTPASAPVQLPASTSFSGDTVTFDANTELALETTQGAEDKARLTHIVSGVRREGSRRRT